MKNYRYILLPGMDGSGLLFEPLLKYLPDNLSVDVIPLSSTGIQAIDAEAKRIASTLNSQPRVDNQPIVLIAESYSGSIAYELCQQPGLNITHVIFIASFISRPSFLCKFAPLLPLQLIKRKVIPNFLLRYLIFTGTKVNKVESSKILKLFYQSIRSVDNKVLKQRLVNIANMEVPGSRTHITASYLRPTRDVFVKKQAISILQTVFKTVDIIKIRGGHFIAQSNPHECAKAIEFLMKKR